LSQLSSSTTSGNSSVADVVEEVEMPLGPSSADVNVVATAAAAAVVVGCCCSTSGRYSGACGNDTHGSCSW
jgi:hypothetical protein